MPWIRNWLRARREDVLQTAFLLAGYRGKYRPAPHPIKMRIIRQYLPRDRDFTFVETGTFFGDTVAALRTSCGSIISIEISPQLFENARQRFAGCANVDLRLGDVVTEFPKVLASLNRPAVFWLDAHWSGEGTGRGVVDDPILLTLRHLANHPIRSHTLLIDDARCFDGQEGRPGLADAILAIRAINERYRILFHADIITACV